MSQLKLISSIVLLSLFLTTPLFALPNNLKTILPEKVNIPKLADLKISLNENLTKVSNSINSTKSNLKISIDRTFSNIQNSLDDTMCGVNEFLAENGDDIIAVGAIFIYMMATIEGDYYGYPYDCYRGR